MLRVEVHQGSVLSPLHIRYRTGGFVKRILLYADDLVLIAETEELLLGKLRSWEPIHSFLTMLIQVLNNDYEFGSESDC